MMRFFLLGFVIVFLSMASITPSMAMIRTHGEGPLNSQHVVDAHVQWLGGNQYCLVMHIDDQWHIYAHPTSVDYLIPTSLTLTYKQMNMALHVQWPDGQQAPLDILNAEFKVYVDEIAIPFQTLSAKTISLLKQDKAKLSAHFQACGMGGRCLMPATIQMPVHMVNSTDGVAQC